MATGVFLFTDLEGSTRLWSDFPVAMRGALAAHDDAIAGAVAAAGGVVFKHTGIGWEWGIVAGCCVVYLCVIESWKAVKRWRGWGAAKVRKLAVIGGLEEGEAAGVVRVEAVEDAGRDHDGVRRVLSKA